MLKQLLLIGAAAVSFPALAQTPPPANDPMAPPTQTDTAPPASEPAQPAPDAQPAPMPDSAQPAPAPVPDASTTPPASEAPPASETPPASDATSAQGTAATPTQIAQIVDQEFPTYDGDSSGELNEAEFASWMKKLRAATEPTVDVESAEVTTWIGQAWAAADNDKSGGISKAELTGFLSRGA